MALLIRPTLKVGEGSKGFLLRLAEANGLDLKIISNLGITFDIAMLNSLGYLPADFENTSLEKYAKSLEKSIVVHGKSWNHKVPRFCPQCLQRDPYWRYEWELLFYDACHEHQVWLIDRCSECYQLLSWKRSSLMRCTCGTNLSVQQAVPCPKAVVRLSRALSHQVFVFNDEHLSYMIAPINLAQLQHFVRMLGTYGDSAVGLMPKRQKANEELVNSWQLTSLAAEILDQWPKSFHMILDSLQSRQGSISSGKLSARFGNFYSLLYRAFKGSEFDFLRSEFESYVAENWRGSFGRRNRRLFEKVHQRMAWIPANVARQVLGISNHRLNDMVKDGLISREERIGKSGRKFTVVSRSDVDAVVEKLESELDLTAAANFLCLKKMRFASLLPMLIPEARKTGVAGCPWAIPRKIIDDLLHIAQQVPEKEMILEGQVTFSHVLRFWPWVDAVIAKLLLEVVVGALAPVARIKHQTGIAGLVFSKLDLNHWHQVIRPESNNYISVPNVAIRLSIKQEVAYFLVRKGLINSEVVRKGRFDESRVKLQEFEDFTTKYKFGRDLAANFGTSSRAVATQLSRIGITPICGPEIDGCRQLLYKNDAELDKALNQLIKHRKHFGKFSKIQVTQNLNINDWKQ